MITRFYRVSEHHLSTLGQGSTFWFTAQFANSTAPQPTEAETQAVVRAKVLLAEDNVVNQKVAVRMLEKLSCRVDVVANGLEAIDAVSRIPYDLVFMDCQMPELDGYRATQAIREQEASTGRHLPIIAMTANAMTGDREQCLQAGMDDYISKPVKPEQLQEMVQKWTIAPGGVIE